MARERAKSRAEWSARLARWERSGLSAEDFARREGVRVEQLSWWLGRLRNLGEWTVAAPVPAPAAFVELVSTGERESAAVEVVLRGGAVVRVSAGFDENTVLRLVRVLDGVGP